MKMKNQKVPIKSKMDVIGKLQEYDLKHIN